MGLKQCIHLVFYLCTVMKFNFKLSRCDENVMPWLPDTVLGYVLEAITCPSVFNTQRHIEKSEFRWVYKTPSVS